MRGRQDFNIATLVRECTASGIPIGVPEMDVISQRMPLEGGEHLIPLGVATFVAKILGLFSPKTMLDPWAGFGLLAIPVAQRLGVHSTRAITPNPEAASVFAKLEGADEIEIETGDPLAALADEATVYDAVISALPFGLKQRGTIRIQAGEEDRIIQADYVALLMIQSCLHLGEDGVAVFIVPTSFFFHGGKNQSRRLLVELGFSVTAAIELPAGTFRPATAVSSHVVLLQRTSEPQIFTAKYLPDERHQQQLLKNLSARSRGKSASLGRLVAPEDFRGFSPVDLAERVREQARSMGLEAHPTRALITAVNMRRSSSDRGPFPEHTNAVYLPQMASTPATTSQQALPGRLKSYFQIVFRPELADAGFIAGLLNTQFGQLWRDSLRTGTTIGRISPTLLEDSTLYLPRGDSLKSQQGVVSCQRMIAEFRNELKEIESHLWRRPGSVEGAKGSLRNLNREESFERWIDTLPFPLASALWRCHAQSENLEPPYQCKSKFFEVLTEFIAVVYLSAFRTNPSLWRAVKKDIKSVLQNGQLSLERATFGTWKAVAESLSRKMRQLLHEDQEVCFEMFRTRDRFLIESIAAKKLIGILQTTCSIRNDWVGHPPAVSEAKARALDEQLSQQIEVTREALGNCWENYELLLPGDCNVRSGLYRYKVRKVTGTRTPFPQGQVELVESMEDGQLHLKSPNEERTLKLLPLVKVIPSPKTADNACYFYDRLEKDGIRFLSYHFVSDPEIIDNFADVEQVLRELLDSSAYL